MKKLKKVLNMVAGSGLAVGMFYMPELLAAVPAAPNVPIGSIVAEDAEVDVLIKTVFGWLMMLGAIGVGIGVAFYFALGIMSGLKRLQDVDDTKYTTGNWLTIAVIGLLSTVIVGVLSYFVFNFGLGLTQ